MTEVQAQAETWQFARFRLEPKRRLLLADGAPVTLSSRAYDILDFLIQNRDRVVTRDELIAHVWRGIAVGENNLAVQLSGLRRALAEHAGGETLIVNLPGRGYQFVGAVTVAGDLPMPAPALPPLVAEPAPPQRRRRLPPIARIAAGLIVLALVLAMIPVTWRIATLDAFSPRSSPIPDERLTVAVQPFVPIGDDPRSNALAARYTQAVLARFGIYEDLVLFTGQPQNRTGFAPHFQLTGAVQVTDGNAVLTVGITETATGRLLGQDVLTVHAGASTFEQFSAAMQLLSDVRPIIFKAESMSRPGPPRDSLDLLVDAHVALGEQDELSQLHKAIPLAEAALHQDPASRSVRALLSLLLTDELLASSAQAGDAEGLRALSLIDGVVLEQPRNFLYILRRAYTLASLRRLDEARATAELGLQIEPEDRFLTLELGEILIASGQLDQARTLLTLNASNTHDDMPATLAFAEERYQDSLALSRQVISAAPGNWYTRFTLLLEAATLVQLGDTREAELIVEQTTSQMPVGIRKVSALRQSFYALPDLAWARFKNGLVKAGMAP